jgi:hypothetical protein
VVPQPQHQSAFSPQMELSSRKLLSPDGGPDFKYHRLNTGVGQALRFVDHRLVEKLADENCFDCPKHDPSRNQLIVLSYSQAEYDEVDLKEISIIRRLVEVLRESKPVMHRTSSMRSDTDCGS